MRKLKGNEHRNCTFCMKEGKTSKAVWTDTGLKACDEHKPRLIEYAEVPERNSEADYMTWMQQ